MGMSKRVRVAMPPDAMRAVEVERRVRRADCVDVVILANSMC